MSDCTEPDRARCPRLCSDFCNEIETQRANDSCPATGSAKYPAIRDNVMRYYDLCVIVREAQAEMKLLNEQYKDLADDARNEDALEWLLSGQDQPAIKEWELANPNWQAIGNGIRAQKRKQND